MLKSTIENIFKKSIAKRGYPSFLLVNTTGWFIFIFVYTLLVIHLIIQEGWVAGVSNTLQWASGYFLTFGLRAIYKNYKYREKSLIKVLGFILFYSLIFSLLYFITSHLIFLAFDPSNFDEYLKTILTYNFITNRTALIILPLMTSWSLLYFGIKFWLDWSKERDRAEKLDLLAQSAQLQMLRYQVNPHFLFNSFSSLRALIRKNQTKAEEMVSKLSEFYRYSLSTKNNSEVPLIEELEAIEYYFEIEKIRFGDKLEYYINIDSLAEEYPVPCFIIHPLVENAIKYGLQTSNLPLTIKIDAGVKKDNLVLSVSNSGKWLKQTDDNHIHGTNTGLNNIKSRLAYSFPNNHKFSFKEEDGFVKVIIEIHKEIK